MAALLYYFLSAREDTEEKMKAIASSTLRMAAEAIFRGSSDNENEAEAAAEVKINSAIAGNKSTPLTIPKAEDEAITASFSAMSIDTVASSVATTEAFSEVATSSSLVSNTDEANDVENIPIINMAEVREHCDPNDGWMVIYDRVYDVTDFLMEHPGGADVMYDYLGYDATIAFRSVGHSTDAMTMLDQYLIGILPRSERLYDNRYRW